MSSRLDELVAVRIASGDAAQRYVDVLASAQLPKLLVDCIDEWHATKNIELLRAVYDTLFEIMRFQLEPSSSSQDIAMVHAARQWAIDTFFALRDDGANDTGRRPLPASWSLANVSVGNAIAVAGDGCQQAVLQSLRDPSAPIPTSAVIRLLELFSEQMPSDHEWVTMVRLVLSRLDGCHTFGESFLRRLNMKVATSEAKTSPPWTQPSTLLDCLDIDARAKVWSNNVQLWQAQLRRWIIEVHRFPFLNVETALGMPRGSAPWRGATHLFLLMRQWFDQHRQLTRSCRAVEMYLFLSKQTRGRTRRSRHQHWNSIESAVSGIRSHFRDFLERAEDVQTTFIGMFGRRRNHQDGEQAIEMIARYHAALDGVSVMEATSVVREMAKGLTNISSTIQWLQTQRTAFTDAPFLRLRMIWFWMLTTWLEPMPGSSTHLQLSPKAVDSVLESAEYLFRRFTPRAYKRHFQVEVMTQLLFDFEVIWVQLVVDQGQARNVMTLESLLEDVTPVQTWLKKIVHLMQLEEQQRTKIVVTDLEQLSARLALVLAI